MISNCWIEAVRLWWLNRHHGAVLCITATKRQYWWIKMPHMYVLLDSGIMIEFVPLGDDLGKFPPPLFRGEHRVKRRPE